MTNDNSTPPTSAAGWVALPLWILRNTDLSGNAVLVLLALMARVNQEGVCWPSHRTIAADAHVSERTARRCLDELRDAGLVSWTGQSDGSGGQGSNLYRLHVERPVAPPVKMADPLGQNGRTPRTTWPTN